MYICIYIYIYIYVHQEKCQEEVGELEQQIRDLSFFTKTKVQVASSHLKEELQGGIYSYICV
jgi:hypothetical protein